MSFRDPREKRTTTCWPATYGFSVPRTRTRSPARTFAWSTFSESFAVTGAGAGAAGGVGGGTTGGVWPAAEAGMKASAMTAAIGAAARVMGAGIVDNGSGDCQGAVAPEPQLHRPEDQRDRGQAAREQHGDLPAPVLRDAEGDGVVEAVQRDARVQGAGPHVEQAEQDAQRGERDQVADRRGADVDRPEGDPGEERGR